MGRCASDQEIWGSSRVRSHVRVRCRLNALLSVTQHCISFLRRGGGRALGHLQADSALCHGTGEVQNLALCQA
ncbi:hypothetical protein Pcinc_030003 [Petrolisthes cinctipes]|uniref:Uncharacterized protein n=1 Tax=Petrolisthes cinctipes TaxID=88211 RepID=A0AAE1EZN4_PETCI|nr:hypothetical protein Pcinc_030003 [Petrolisthes cinctipes]